jgi:hypothetical protein
VEPAESARWSFFFLAAAVFALAACTITMSLMLNAGSVCVGNVMGSAAISSCFPLYGEQIVATGVIGGVSTGIFLLSAVWLRFAARIGGASPGRASAAR